MKTLKIRNFPKGGMSFTGSTIVLVHAKVIICWRGLRDLKYHGKSWQGSFTHKDEAVQDFLTN